MTARFIEGKIVREDGYWDISKLIMDIQEMKPQKTYLKKLKKTTKQQADFWERIFGNSKKTVIIYNALVS